MSRGDRVDVGKSNPLKRPPVPDIFDSPGRHIEDIREPLVQTIADVLLAGLAPILKVDGQTIENEFSL